MGVNERTMPSNANDDYPFSTMEKAEQKEYLMSIRSLLYVAITRAIQAVLITGVGDKSKLIKE